MFNKKIIKGEHFLALSQGQPLASPPGTGTPDTTWDVIKGQGKGKKLNKQTSPKHPNFHQTIHVPFPSHLKEIYLGAVKFSFTRWRRILWLAEKMCCPERIM